MPCRRQRYCSSRCQHRVAGRRYRERQAEREDAAHLEQTRAILERNTHEGYDNLSWRNGSAEA
jgi:hypothetical protein